MTLTCLYIRHKQLLLTTNIVATRYTFVGFDGYGKAGRRQRPARQTIGEETTLMRHSFPFLRTRQGWLGLAGAACVSVVSYAVMAGASPPPAFDFPEAAAISAERSPQSAAAQAGMIAIPAGSYPIGSDRGRSDQRPEHRVQLSAFLIDHTEVTNAAFAEFLN
ncbi:MAG TPA: hypothetical protein EYH07_04850, partial [Kiloniellaceae bacterium]|nr:hypothetical protein [Kiloniellaceae bacterium]